jgi:hypothetical protein
MATQTSAVTVPSTSAKLEDQAATAALYAARAENKDVDTYLDADHKLSSAGKFTMAHCMKYFSLLTIQF